MLSTCWNSSYDINDNELVFINQTVSRVLFFIALQTRDWHIRTFENKVKF